MTKDRSVEYHGTITQAEGGTFDKRKKSHLLDKHKGIMMHS